MNRRINYWWKCNEFKDIPEPLVDVLEVLAIERIANILKEGYSSGELIAYVNIDVPNHKTPEDGWHCLGWFEQKDLTNNK